MAALGTACSALEIEAGGLRIEVANRIPLKRGLGSSAAAIVGGIKIAEKLSGRQLAPDEVFELAYPLEGHPDNLSASLLGGWVVSRVSEGRMRAVRLKSALDCCFVLAVPELQVSTVKAREILPSSFSLSDTVFNLQRIALLIHAISAGEPHLSSAYPLNYGMCPHCLEHELASPPPLAPAPRRPWPGRPSAGSA